MKAEGKVDEKEIYEVLKKRFELLVVAEKEGGSSASASCSRRSSENEENQKSRTDRILRLQESTTDGEWLLL